MDPITATLIAAIIAGAAAGATDVSKKMVVDAYDGVKTLFKRKLGAENDLSDAIEKLESKPESNGRKTTLQEEVEATKVDQDDDILTAIRALHEQLKDNNDERVQTMIGSFGGEQFMRGKGGKMAQNMENSPQGKQRME